MKLVEEARGRVGVQDYSPRPKIGGVFLAGLSRSTDDGGSFVELTRFASDGVMERVLGAFFKIRQINHSEVEPGAVKAWHIHQIQTDVWYVPPRQRLLVGLWDLREESPTADVKMRLILGAGQAQLLVIPPGVAHGCANLSWEPVDIFYLINRQFSPKPEETDEGRLPWDILGAKFWEMSKG